MTTKTKPTIDNRCSNCGNPIGKVGVLSPTVDPKKRNMCLGCAGKMVKSTIDNGIKETAKMLKRLTGMELLVFQAEVMSLTPHDKELQEAIYQELKNRK